MLKNAYFLAKIGADTAENEQHFAEILPTDAMYGDPPRPLEALRPELRARRRRRRVPARLRGRLRRDGARGAPHFKFCKFLLQNFANF